MEIGFIGLGNMGGPWPPAARGRPQSRVYDTRKEAMAR